MLLNHLISLTLLFSVVLIHSHAFSTAQQSNSPSDQLTSWYLFDPFYQSFPESNSKSSDGYTAALFVSYISAPYVDFFDYVSTNLPAQPATEPSEDILDKKSQYHMSCSTCLWLTDKIQSILPSCNSEHQLQVVLEEICLNSGFSLNECQTLAWGVTPEILGWFRQGFELQQYCSCSDSQTSETEEEPVPIDTHTTTETGVGLIQVVVGIVVGVFIFGMMFVSVRLCQTVKRDKREAQKDQESASTLPAYSQLQSVSEDSDVPKYVFSAQDAALIYPLSFPLPSNPESSTIEKI